MGYLFRIRLKRNVPQLLLWSILVFSIGLPVPFLRLLIATDKRERT